MCRLCAVLGSIPLGTKTAIMDYAMILGASENNVHGYGAWTSDLINKCSGSYLESNLESFWDVFVEGSRDTYSLCSHVRSASYNTGKTVLEAHPYQFKSDLGGLVMAHNGTFYGTKATDRATDVPDTDSYRAFQDLFALLSQRSEINSDVFQEWLGRYTTGSTFSTLITDQVSGDVWALRGPEKPLNILPIGDDGWFINTSTKIVTRVSQLLQMHYGISCGAMIELGVGDVLRFRPGQAEPDSYRVDIILNPYYHEKKEPALQRPATPSSAGWRPDSAGTVAVMFGTDDGARTAEPIEMAQEMNGTSTNGTVYKGIGKPEQQLMLLPAPATPVISAPKSNQTTKITLVDGREIDVLVNGNASDARDRSVSAIGRYNNKYSGMHVVKHNGPYIGLHTYQNVWRRLNKVFRPMCNELLMFETWYNLNGHEIELFPSWRSIFDSITSVSVAEFDEQLNLDKLQALEPDKEILILSPAARRVVNVFQSTVRKNRLDFHIKWLGCRPIWHQPVWVDNKHTNFDITINKLVSLLQQCKQQDAKSRELTLV